MTIPNQPAQVTYDGNGVTTIWDYDFIIPSDNAARVGLFDIATNVLTLLNPGDYTISGLDNPNGGSVTYPLVGSPLDSTKRIVIWRDVEYDQPTQLTNQTPFYPKVLERQLDRIVMQVQQLRDEIERSIKVTLGSNLTPDQFVSDLQEGAADAQASADDAAASAAAAAASLALTELPAVGVALNYLRRNAANTMYENRTPEQVRTDLNLVRQTDENDFTYNRVLTVGSFGIGRVDLGNFVPPNFSSADLTPAEVRTLLGNRLGFYTFAGPTGDSIQLPPGFPSSHGVIKGYLNSNNGYTYTWQELTGTNGLLKYRRRALTGITWGPWRLVYHQENIIASVGFASGVPTGGIFSGWNSNANGLWRRTADGAQECISPILTIATCNQAVGTGFITTAVDRINWVYPVSFSEAPYVTGEFIGVDGFWANVGNPGSTQLNAAYLGSTISRTGLSNNVRFYARGRWN